MATQPLTNQHAAVLTAIGIGIFKKYETPDMVLRAANKLLNDGGNDGLDKRTFDSILGLLKNGGLIDDTTGEFRFLAKANYKGKNPKDPKKLVELRKLPKDIHLINKPLLKSGIEYGIVFNFDGCGSIKTPDGSIISGMGNLQHANDDVVKLHGVVDKEGKGGNLRWYVDPKYHTNVLPNTLLKDWMDEHYPITE